MNKRIKGREDELMNVRSRNQGLISFLSEIICQFPLNLFRNGVKYIIQGDPNRMSRIKYIIQSDPNRMSRVKYIIQGDPNRTGLHSSRL